jgi:hypothetical protein
LSRKTSKGIACDMVALNPEQQNRHDLLLHELFREVRRIRDLRDGLSFDISDSSSRLAGIAEWIALERLCCPFMRFKLDVRPRPGNIRLSITGPPGTKELLAEYTKQR